MTGLIAVKELTTAEEVIASYRDRQRAMRRTIRNAAPVIEPVEPRKINFTKPPSIIVRKERFAGPPLPEPKHPATPSSFPPLPPRWHPFGLSGDPDSVDLPELIWSPPTMDEIAKLVCWVHRVSELDLKSKRRAQKVSRARFHFYYLCRKHTMRSLPEIGRFIKRDHTSVLHGLRQWPKRKADMRRGVKG